MINEIENGDGANDPVERDARIIAERAADLQKARASELSDDEKRRGLLAERQRIDAELAATDADKTAQRAREQEDEKAIADLDADAQRRTGTAPGPNPPPQPPRPRVG